MIAAMPAFGDLDDIIADRGDVEATSFDFKSGVVALV